MRILNTFSNLVLFKDQKLDTLGVHYKKITLIVSAIFAAIGTYFLLHYFYKSQSIIKAKHDINANRSSTDVEIVQLSQSTLTSVPVSSSSAVNTQVNPQTPPSVEYGDVADSADIDDIDDDDDNDEEWDCLNVKGNKNGFESQTLTDEERDAEFGSHPFDESGLGTRLERESKRERRVHPPKKYEIDGKIVSLRILKCLQSLKVSLAELGKEYGTATDDGDCFWDAFAQRISVIKNKSITIKELREVVSREVQIIDQGPSERNWVKEMMKGNTMETYEQYRDRVAYSCAEAMQNGFDPVWGKGERDGVILAYHYRVNLKIYRVEYLEEAGKKINLEKIIIPEMPPYSKTVELAVYPDHYMPVQDKTK